MTYREYVPPPALRPYVDRLWTTTGDGAGAPQRILPDGCVDVLVRLSDGAIDAVGAMTRAVLVPPSERGMTVAVRFRPGGAAPFLGVAAHELTDERARVADLGARALSLEHVVHAPPRRAVTALADALVARVRRGSLDVTLTPPGPWFEHAIERLLAPAPLPIAALARSLGKSRQHLTRVTRELVGVTPKELARIARMQRAIIHLQGSPAVDLAEVALRFGYFDQAHMTRDFRLLAGVSPALARREAGSIFPIRSLFARDTNAP